MYEEKEIEFKKRKIQKKRNKKVNKNNKKFKNISFKPHKIILPDFLKRINWKQMLLKLITLLFVMFLIIFVISRINKNNKEKNLTLDNNIQMIANSALNFYSNNNLPQNIGDSNSILLEEMIKKDLINNLKDKKEKECNTLNSYSIITKIKEEEYRLKIFLTCPSEEKMVEMIVTCNTTCQIKK